MSSELIAFSINHKTAPLEVRERLRLNEEQRATLESSLQSITDEFLVLSTCERFEVYVVTAFRQCDNWLAQLRHSIDIRHSTIDNLASHHASWLQGIAASLHLLRVAAGLESRIVGEPHVLGQVRQAYTDALTKKKLGPVLSALGRAAIHTGKRVRHETSLNPSARSIVTLTVEALHTAIGPLSGTNVLVLGSGRLAGDLAATLAYRGAKLRFISRSLERAQSLAVRHQAPAAALTEISRWLEGADAIVACSSAPSYLLQCTHLDFRRARRLSIIDLSVPRNVDPAVAACPGIGLEHLDDLLRRQAAGSDGVEAAEQIVAEENERFCHWRRERSIAPRIAALTTGIRHSGGDDPTRSRRLHQRIMNLKWETAA